MSNGDTQQYNCIIGACCGGEDGAKQVKAYADMLKHDLGPGPHSAHEIATWAMGRFDHAVKGTLSPLVESVAGFARGFPYDG